MAAKAQNFGEKTPSNDYDEKKAIVTDKLQKRDEARVEGIIKKKEEKETVAKKEENTTFFIQNFQKLRQSITDSLAKTSSVPKSEMSTHLSSISKELETMSKFLTDSTIYLPSYDVQKSQEVISSLQVDLLKTEQEFMPKKKFAFKARSKTTDKTDGKNETVAKQTIEVKKFNIQIDEVAVRDKSKETVTFGNNDISDKDIVLANLEDCTVILYGNCSSMQVDNLRNCKVYCGPVSRSVFINNSENCVFVLACQQLRIHHTNKTSFFIHVTTKAIIEDTKNVKFGKYCLKYPNIDEDYKKSGLDLTKNNWDDVDDFNYLASGSKSPNWTIISSEEQSAFEKSINQ